MEHRELGQTATDVPNRAILHHLARNVLARIPRVDVAEGQHLLGREAVSLTLAMTPALRPTRIAPDGHTPPRHVARSAHTAEGLR